MSKLKVLTYVNLKFSSIIILLLSSMIFGYRYLSHIGDRSNTLLTCIEWVQRPQVGDLNINKVQEKKTISLVSKNVKKGIFRTKVEYDTVYKTYNEFDKKSYSNEYNRVIKENSIEINRLIKMNNMLTLKMKLIIDEYTGVKTMISFNEKKSIIDRLMNNIRNYIITSFILIILIIFLTYLLISDIRKIRRTNKRYNDTVSLLMDKMKEK